ncbi:hypothetical protein HMPREF0023_1050 [Acinetobacter sp. ATCC 27244]|nr:hypothetical protein HMPREF0023_1050 [Acinetobacter sp. ATCC 27244]
MGVTINEFRADKQALRNKQSRLKEIIMDHTNYKYLIFIIFI